MFNELRHLIYEILVISNGDTLSYLFWRELSELHFDENKNYFNSHEHVNKTIKNQFVWIRISITNTQIK